MTYASTVLSDGATYLWMLNEATGTSATDSADSNTGTYIGGFALNASGPAGIGNGVTLSAGTGMIKTTNVGRAYTGPWSCDLWFETSGAGGLLSLDNSATGGNPTQGLYVGSDGKLYYAQFTGSIVSINSTALVTSGTWQYAAFVMNASNNCALYLNGSSVASNANTTALGIANNWQLGCWPQTGSGWPNNTVEFLTGSMCAVAVYNTTALTPTQVTNHFNAGAGSGGGPPLSPPVVVGQSMKRASYY